MRMSVFGYICGLILKIDVKTLRVLMLALLLAPCSGTAVRAEGKLDLDFYTRVEYNYVSGTDACAGETSGFRGRHIYVRASGDLGSGFSYSIAHRLNNVNSQTKYFESTDWSILTYTTPNRRWAFNAGKIVMEAGSFEWDDNPIYVPFFVGSVNLVNPYQIGASVIRYYNGGSFSFLCTRSQYDTELDNCLTYSLEWRPTVGFWNGLYIAQFIEEGVHGGFFQFGLGNRFTGDLLSLDVDILARTSPFYAESWRHLDFTADFKLSCRITDKLSVYSKCGYERNDNDIAFDPMSPLGTDTGIASLGLDFFPTGSRDIQLFCFAASSGGSYGGALNRYTRACFGLLWKIDMISW